MNHTKRATIKNLRSKIKPNQLVISEADKSNALVVMKKMKYHPQFTKVIQDMWGVESTDFCFDARVAEVRKLIGEGAHNYPLDPSD